MCCAIYLLKEIYVPGIWKPSELRFTVKSRLSCIPRLNKLKHFTPVCWEVFSLFQINVSLLVVSARFEYNTLSLVLYVALHRLCPRRVCSIVKRDFVQSRGAFLSRVNIRKNCMSNCYVAYVKPYSIRSRDVNISAAGKMNVCMGHVTRRYAHACIWFFAQRCSYCTTCFQSNCSAA